MEIFCLVCQVKSLCKIVPDICTVNNFFKYYSLKIIKCYFGTSSYFHYESINLRLKTEPRKENSFNARGC